MTFLNQQAAGQHKGCEDCGGKLLYDVVKKSLVCQSCSRWAPIETFDSFIEGRWPMMEVVEYTCPQCGAAVHTTQTNMVSYCSFCGSTVMFNQRMTQTRKPEKIIPFRITREACEKIYNERIGKNRFVPDEMKNHHLQLQFQPIYVPFYVYTEAYEGTSQCTRYAKYVQGDYNIKETLGLEVESNIQVTGEMHCASSQFEPEIAERLQFDLTDVCEFHPAYLCGFYAEAPDMDDQRRASGLETFASALVEKQLAPVSPTGKTVVKLPPKTKDEVEVILLPVWLLAEKQGGRVVYTAINGVNGNYVCDTPVDKKKAVGFTALMAAAFAVLFFLLSTVLILRPKLVAGLTSLIAAAGYYVINHAWRKHQEGEETKQQLRQTRRVRLNKEQQIAKARAKGVLGMEMAVLGWMLAAVLALPLMLVVFLFTPEAFPVGLGSGVAFVIFVIRAVKKAKEVSSVRTEKHTLGEWLLVYGARFLVAGAGMLLLNTLIADENALVAALVADNGWLAPYMCGCALLSMVVNPFTNVSGKIDKALSLASTILVGMLLASCLFLFKQYIFYTLAMVLMGLLTVSILRLLGKHNEHVTRPVPYFTKEGEQ